MHCGVFNVPHELRFAKVGPADDCLPAEHLNGTSLSEESRASLQQLVMARQGSYDPLRSHFLS